MRGQRVIAAGLLMLAVLAFFALGGALAWWLVEGLASGGTRVRGVWYTRSETPGSYWFYVSAYAFWLGAWGVLLLQTRRDYRKAGGWSAATARLAERLAAGS